MQPARKLDDGPSDSLRSPCSQARPAARIAAKDGSAADIDCDDVIRVRDRQGAILFEYDPERGRGRLMMRQGDLRLEAPKGNIHLIAGGEVRCMAAGELALHSASAVSMTAGGVGTHGGIRVDRGSTAIAGRRLSVSADEADIRIDRARYAGKWLEAGVERAELLLGKLDSRVGTLIQRATHAFHYVEELHQLKAKRLRIRAEESMVLDAGHVVMTARDDVDIDGKQINLG